MVFGTERTPIRTLDLFTHASRICRFGGALPWTLLQHSALCVALGYRKRLPDPVVAAVAAHDLHEVYVGDVVAALKQVLPEYKARVETPWEAHVHRALRISWPLEVADKAAVKAIDIRALAVEMVVLGHPRAARIAQERSDYGIPIDAFERWLATTIQNLPPAAAWEVVASACGIVDLPNAGEATARVQRPAHGQGTSG